MRKEYYKLVRDRIPEIIEREGKEFEVRVLDEAEYREALRRKVVEEATEIKTAPDSDLIKEIGDLYEVLDALIATYDLDPDVIHVHRARRRAERGGFEKQLELLWVE